MDKQTKKSTVKIKIDGKEQKFEDDLLVHHWSGQEMAAAAEKDQKEEDDFDWVLPDEEAVTKKEEFQPMYYVPKPKRKKLMLPGNSGKSIASIMFSIVSAMVIGISLGYGIIHFMQKEDTPNSQPTNQMLQENEGKDSKAATSPPEQKKGREITLPELSTNIVQGGVFGEEDAAKKVKQSIAAKEVPVEIVNQDGNQLLVLGTSNELGTAKLLGEKLKKKDMDVYAKSLSISGTASEFSKKDEALLTEMLALFDQSSKESMDILLNKEVDDSTIASLRKKIEKQKTNNEKMIQLQTALLQATKEIESFQQTKDIKNGEKAQGYLLKFMKIYSK
ncbi:stage II sporulation protein B [Oikeobacillus pervagus]|uniref:Stage II sporulation protein B n=1 Tax=Oikeobacillus pervagus TaxID=1325931 RepID=A0AAJ1SXL0_9BACI|nr:hypothetical protein [Oikeobacillus pervagus]MDQ0214549.1 stage II sporulation protein B [Oikeobacillus pervagus]